MHRVLRVFVLMVACALCNAAHADTISFTYSGTSVLAGTTGSSAGTGAISFTGAPSTLALADITGFSFSLTTSIPISVGVATFSYSLADLTSFSATLNNDQLLSLMLGTDAVSPANPTFGPEAFDVTSLGANGAATYNSIGTKLQSGSVAQVPASSPVPEPSSLLLLATGVLGVMRKGARRKCAVARAEVRPK